MMRAYQNKNPITGEKIYIAGSAEIIGDVTIGDNSSIWPQVTVRGDVNYITIGRNTNIQDNSILHVTSPTAENSDGFPLIIGDDVTIGHGVVAHGCIINDNCLIGMGSIILDGAIVENSVMLGAGSLVSPGKTLKSGYLYLGRPAKKARELSSDELQGIAKSARHYVELKNTYL